MYFQHADRNRLFLGGPLPCGATSNQNLNAFDISQDLRRQKLSADRVCPDRTEHCVQHRFHSHLRVSMRADQSCELGSPRHVDTEANDAKAWHGWDKEHEGRCNNINAQSWAAAGINIALDVAVVSLPL